MWPSYGPANINVRFLINRFQLFRPAHGCCDAQTGSGSGTPTMNELVYLQAKKVFPGWPMTEVEQPGGRLES